MKKNQNLNWGDQLRKGLETFWRNAGVEKKLIPGIFFDMSSPDDDKNEAEKLSLVEHCVASILLEKRWELFDFVALVLTSCETPIEKGFATALISIAFESVDTVVGVYTPAGNQMELHRYEHAPTFEKLIIESQKKIKNYRVDFLLTYQSHGVVQDDQGKPRLAIDRQRELIVECDGHEFHEKTKEQASRDKKRDRDLQKLGYEVFRFPGSDLWKNPVACAKEVLDYVCRCVPVLQRDGATTSSQSSS